MYWPSSWPRPGARCCGWAAAPAMPAAPATERRRVNPGKVKMVAEILGLEAEDEEAVLARLIDEFLALKGA